MALHLALTGVYALIVVLALIVILTGDSSVLLKLLGILGAALCAEAHWYINGIYNSGARYRRLFKEAHERLHERVDDK